MQFIARRGLDVTFRFLISMSCSTHVACMKITPKYSHSRRFSVPHSSCIELYPLWHYTLRWWLRDASLICMKSVTQGEAPQLYERTLAHFRETLHTMLEVAYRKRWSPISHTVSHVRYPYPIKMAPEKTEKSEISERRGNNINYFP